VITTRPDTPHYPHGYVKIYRDGMLRDQDPLTENDIRPRNTASALRIATATRESFFHGAIGKVAVYGRELPAERIARHHSAMTGPRPGG
jgi:hypothetical protein